MKKLLHLILIFVGLLSCKKEPVAINDITTVKNKITIKKVQQLKKTAPKKNKKQTPKKEKIVLETVNYPKFSKSKFKIFGTGIFFDKPKINDLENWYGIFYYKKLKKHYISKTKLKISNANLGGNYSNNFSVKTTNKDKCLLLMSSFFLPEIEIIEEKTVPRLIFPGDTINFHFLNKEYTLHATGIKKKMEGQPKMFYSYNYKLYLTSMKNNKKITTLLVAVPSPDPYISITFMGDIDGDKNLDLIINASNHYSLKRLVLFLSKPASKDESVKPIGKFDKSCC